MGLRVRNLHSYQQDISGTNWVALDNAALKTYLDLYNVGGDVWMSVGWETPTTASAFLIPAGGTYEFDETLPAANLNFKLVNPAEPTKIYMIGG